MSERQPYLHVGGIRDAETFRRHLRRLELSTPCDAELSAGDDSPLARPLRLGGIELGNRFAVHPMEGWDGTAEGRPTELTARRWRNFGASGAKLVWGCEAVAVRHDGRANPRQLVINRHARDDLARLREALVASHRDAAGSADGLLVGLQLTHSGRAPSLRVGVRLSAFDTIPFRPDPASTKPGRPGPGVPEPFDGLLPYRWGFGVNPADPGEPAPAEAARLLSLLAESGVSLVNVSAGSPYYNPHVQRPALYPPSDGYLPPEDPLVGVARQMRATRALKQQFPGLLLVGSAYTYLQEFLPHVAQAAVCEGWADAVGLGRMVLSYPALPLDVLRGRVPERRRLCRTFSDCTTAPRAGLPSGCYPLDDYYRTSEAASRLKRSKGDARAGGRAREGCSGEVRRAQPYALKTSRPARTSVPGYFWKNIRQRVPIFR